MSRSYENRKKARKREADTVEPYRKHVRRQIRAGILPRWSAIVWNPEKVFRGKDGEMVKTGRHAFRILGFRSAMRLLTGQKTEAK